MNADAYTSSLEEEPKKSGCLKTFLIVLAVAVVTCALTVWFMNAYLFPKRLKPVELSQKEEKTLKEKWDLLDPFSDASADEKKAIARKYSEDGSNRTITFTQREVNGMLAKNTDMADRLAIHLSDDLASARLLVPLDQDFPILGGKTLKASAGLVLGFSNGKPRVALKGVSLWGVPIPNAWLGGLKNVDLVGEFGGSDGFWKSFSDGVEDISLEDGQLSITLKE